MSENTEEEQCYYCKKDLTSTRMILRNNAIHAWPVMPSYKSCHFECYILAINSLDEKFNIKFDKKEPINKESI